MKYLLLFFLAGCATAINGNSQTLSVQTYPSMLSECTLKNDKGSWTTKTDSVVIVMRSYDDIEVACKHGRFGGSKSVKSTVSGKVAGNLFFGGVIGLGIDAIDGSMYDYPGVITVPMGY